MYFNNSSFSTVSSVVCTNCSVTRRRIDKCVCRVLLQLSLHDVVDVHRTIYFFFFLYENRDKAAYDIYLIPANRFLCSKWKQTPFTFAQRVSHISWSNIVRFSWGNLIVIDVFVLDFARRIKQREILYTRTILFEQRIKKKTKNWSNLVTSQLRPMSRKFERV